MWITRVVLRNNISVIEDILLAILYSIPYHVLEKTCTIIHNFGSTPDIKVIGVGEKHGETAPLSPAHLLSSQSHSLTQYDLCNTQWSSLQLRPTVWFVQGPLVVFQPCHPVEVAQYPQAISSAASPSVIYRVLT